MLRALVMVVVLSCARLVLADPPVGHVWQPIPELTDEFNGARLDASKWHDRNPTWQGRQPGWFSPSNVCVSEGCLRLTARLEDLPGLPKGYHTFTTAAVKSKARSCYGYFEIKARAMNSRASSAFWFYAQDTNWWTEIDVFEIGGAAPEHAQTVHMNAHVFETPSEGKKHWSKGADWKAPFRLAGDFHVYALEWDKDELRYFVDGVCRHTLKNTHWHQPLHLNFDSETMPEWFGLPTRDKLPAVFSIDYVRAWRRAD